MKTEARCQSQNHSSYRISKCVDRTLTPAAFTPARVAPTSFSPVRCTAPARKVQSAQILPPTSPRTTMVRPRCPSARVTASASPKPGVASRSEVYTFTLQILKRRGPGRKTGHYVSGNKIGKSIHAVNVDVQRLEARLLPAYTN